MENKRIQGFENNGVKPTVAVPTEIDDLDDGATIKQDIVNLQNNKQNNLDEQQLSAVNSGITWQGVGQIGQNASNINTINNKIPAQASSSNKLADKNFVNSSIATNTAYFIGTFANVSELINVGLLEVGSTILAGSYIAEGSDFDGTVWESSGNLETDITLSVVSKLADRSMILSGSTIKVGSIINHEYYNTQTTISNDILIEDTATNNDYANVLNSERDFANTTDMNAFDKDLLTDYDYAWIPNNTNYDLYRFDIVSQTWGLRATNIAKNDVQLITAYNRYTYNGDTKEWTWNYKVNTTGFTAEQWEAINSGITTSLVSKIGNVVAGDINSESATAGQVLQADGSGGASWGAASGGNYVSLDNSDQTFSGDKKLIVNNGKNFNLQIGVNGSFQVGYGSNFFKFNLVNGEAKFYGSGNKMLVYRSLSCGLSVNKGSGIYYLEFPNRTTTGTIACVDDITAKVPDAPTTDGTYTLKVVVSNGTPTYQWVLDV